MSNQQELKIANEVARQVCYKVGFGNFAGIVEMIRNDFDLELIRTEKAKNWLANRVVYYLSKSE